VQPPSATRGTRKSQKPDPDHTIWLAAGLRTPFARVDGDLKHLDAIAISVPVVQAMAKQLAPGTRPDFVVWGTVMPNLGVSNVAREVVLDSALDPAMPACSTVLACATSMVATFEGGYVDRGGRDHALAGGVESMGRVQFGLNQNFSDWMRRLFQARTLGERVDRFAQIKLKDVRLFIPTVTNRTTGKSMGEHCEEMVTRWNFARETQDRLAYSSHERAVRAMASDIFNDLMHRWATSRATARHVPTPRSNGWRSCRPRLIVPPEKVPVAPLAPRAPSPRATPRRSPTAPPACG
jgi:acetyl-CoA C-acetyltransferase